MEKEIGIEQFGRDLIKYYNENCDKIFNVFQELKNGHNPSLNTDNRHAGVSPKDFFNGSGAMHFHSRVFLKFTYEYPNNALNDIVMGTIRTTFQPLVKIRNVFLGEWNKTFKMDETDPIKTEWRELLSDYRNAFVDKAIDDWLEYYVFLKKEENMIDQEGLKLGEKKLMAFSYLIGKMIETGIIRAPYDYDSKGEKVIYYSRVARTLTSAFEIKGEIKNFAKHLNPEKNELAPDQKRKIDGAFSTD